MIRLCWYSQGLWVTARQSFLTAPALVQPQGTVQAVDPLVVPGMPPAAQYLEQLVESIGGIACYGLL